MIKTIRYIRWTRFLSTVRRTSLKLRKYVFTKTIKSGRRFIAIWTENKHWVKCHARKNLKQQYMKVVSFSDPSLSKKCICLRPCSLCNTLNTPSSGWESFNIKQKLGLFVLRVTHISNLPIVCVKLMRVGGWA